MQLVLRVAMMEQLKEVRLGEDPPHEIALSALESADGDTEEWDTTEEPPVPIPAPRAPRKAKTFSCMTGETTHRWFKSTGNTYECSICKSNRDGHAAYKARVSTVSTGKRHISNLHREASENGNQLLPKWNPRENTWECVEASCFSVVKVISRSTISYYWKMLIFGEALQDIRPFRRCQYLHREGH